MSGQAETGEGKEKGTGTDNGIRGKKICGKKKKGHDDAWRRDKLRSLVPIQLVYKMPFLLMIEG